MSRAASCTSAPVLLAPLRGVTIRAFRETFAKPLYEAGFTAAVAPFIPANPGLRVTEHLLADLLPGDCTLPIIPQVITRHPDALKIFLEGIKARGFTRADLNAGCPFPMIVRRGRGSGLFRTLDLFERLVAVGCDVMGPGNFSVKTRLGLAREDELKSFLPILNRYPLAGLTIHARTARQMYTGTCAYASAEEIARSSTCPVILNGDLDTHGEIAPCFAGRMVGRAFIRALGQRDDAADFLRAYVTRSQEELCGDHPVLGRLKELLTYWAEGSTHWRRLWPMIKICRTVDELVSIF